MHPFPCYMFYYSRLCNEYPSMHGIIVYFVAISELDSANNQLQCEEFAILNNTTATHLRFNIQTAYDHFCSVHRVHVDGTAVH